ncbi:MAG: long-chain fatty acid--CoA ligase [Microthrixaceae bacterium]
MPLQFMFVALSILCLLSNLLKNYFAWGDDMQGTMQDRPLTLNHFVERAERYTPSKLIVTGTAQGVEQTTYGDWAERTRKLVKVLDNLGVAQNARVGTFAWNSARHLELYFAAPCSGRVLHTLNIRLFPQQLTYIVNHAEDDVIFVDRSLLGLLAPLFSTFTTVRHVVVMEDGGTADNPEGVELLDYEELLAASDAAEFHVLEETSAAAMCYTSGTTGNPKGVVYTHRSTYLHTLAVLQADGIGIRESDTVMPVVPMFHANAWGLAHAGVATGANLVLAGPRMTPPALADLIVDQRVTVPAGVPTIWMGVLPELVGRDTSALRVIPCGGSAVPKALSEAYREQLGLPILQAWGMTETSPIASVGLTRSWLSSQTEEELAELRASQGPAVLGVELRILDQETGAELPWDGRTRGELQAAGPWIAAGYYNDDRSSESFTQDGWLRTGDVAVISPDGYVRIVDRTKDVVKSGGEWISSVELENEIMAHPAVAEAAVIGLPHQKWGERPFAAVVVRPDATLSKEEILEFLDGRVASWWLPDDIVFIDEVPKTSVGKFSKKDLRDRFANHVLPTE